MQRFKYWYTCIEFKKKKKSVISCPGHKISKPRLLYRQLDNFLKNPDVKGKKHSFCPEENSLKYPQLKKLSNVIFNDEYHTSK